MKNHSLRSHRTSMSLRLLFSLLTAVVMLLMVATAGAGVTLTATKTDALVGDLDGDSQADPGDTLEYIVVITNNTGAPVNNVVFADTVDANTSFVSGSLVASPVAINDTYPQIIIGNVSIDSSLIPYSVTSNDFLGLNATTTISAFDATSASGGQVTMTTSGANMGQFTYNPPPGFEGTDTFTYTLNNSSGSNTATVSITVSGMVWFIKNGVSLCTTLAAGCGRLSNPFSTLGAFNALNDGSGSNPAANDNIFVYESASEYTGAVTLLSGQKLIGQDATASLETITGLTRPSSSPAFPAMNSGNGTVTNLGSTVTLNNNVTVRGLQINSATSTGMNDPAGAITGVAVSEVSVSSTTATAVALSDLGGTFAFTSISSNGGTSDGISIANQTGSFTVDGDGSNTAVGGNGTGGTIQNKSGADGSTSSGIGIYLNNVNNITLRRMTINGANQNYGIRGFAVNNFTLEYATVGGTNGTAASLPDPENAGEGSIYFGNYSITGLTNSASMNKVSISGGRARNFSVINTSSTLNRLTITGSSFGKNREFDNGVDYASDSLSVEARNSGTVLNATVTGSTFSGAPGDLAEFVGQIGTAMDVVFQNNTLSNNHADNKLGGGGMTLATGGAMTLNVTNNTFRDADGSAITLQLAAPPPGNTSATSLNGTLTGNTIGVSGVAGSGSKTGNGIFLSFADNTTSPKGQVTLAITNNIIRQYSGNAAIYDDNTGGNYNTDLTITGNTTDQPGAGVLYGLALTAGAPSSSDDIDVCASITGNNISAGDPNNNNDVIVGVSTALSSMRLPGYTGNSLAQVEKFIRDNNSIPSAPAVTAYVTAPATKDNFIGGAACSTPSAYLLPSGNRRMVAQANIDGSGLDRAPRQNETGSAGFNLPLDLSKWLKETTFVNKDYQPNSTPASHRLALPSLSTLVDSLGRLFAIPTAHAAPADMPNSAPDVTVTVGALPGNKSVTIKFRATIAADLPSNVTQVSNQGTATFDGGSELTDDPATPALNDATITEIPQPDLAVAKSDTPDPVNAGENITYAIDLGNNGAAGAQTVTLTDAVPANTTFVSALVTSGSGWTATAPAVGGTGNVVFSKATMAASESAAFQIIVKVSSSMANGATITNLATAATTSADSNSSNNTAAAATTVQTRADLALTKTDSPDPVNAASNITYVLSFVNNGPSDAQTVTVTDAVPANTTFVSALVTSGLGWSISTPAVGGTGNVVFSKATMTAAESAAFQIVVRVNNNTPNAATITNSATAASATIDPASGNNTASATTTAYNSDLTVTKTNDVSGTIPQGGTWKWKLTAQNSGGVAPTFAAGQTILVDALPGTNISYNPPAVSNFNGTGTINCAIAGNTLTCTATAGTAVTIPANTGKFDVEFTATPSAVGTFTNPTGGTCKVDPNGNVVESDETNNACNSNSVTVVAPPVISKTFGASHIALNGTTGLTIALTNPTANSVALTGVAMTDPLPAGLQVAGAPNASNTCGITFAPASGATTLNASGITLGAGSSCTLKVDVTGTTPGPKTNTTDAVTSANGGTGNSASATLQVAMPPVISKAFGAASRAVNESTALTFAITNPDSVVSLTGVGFTDNLPSGLQVASTPNPANTCGGSFTTVAGSSSVALTNASLAPSASCSLRVNLVATSVGIKDNTTSNVTSNEGGSGNAASASITVAQGASTISLVKTPVTAMTYGDTIYFTATVAAAFTGPAAPSGGTVQFFDNGAAISGAVALSGSQAFFSTSSLTAGTHNNLTAVYSGDTNFSPSSPSSPVTQQVNRATPTFSNLSSPTIPYGTPTTTVSGKLVYGSLIPSGNVIITINGVEQPAAINASTGNFASDFATGALGVAGSPYVIAFNYSGDTNFAAQSDNSHTLSVTKDNTSIAASSSANPSTYGQTVTISAKVTSSGPSTATPMGMVTFTIDGSLTVTGAVNGSGVASFDKGDLTVGAHSEQMDYSGDSNFNPSTQTFAQNVSKATPVFSNLSAPTIGYGTTPTTITGALKLGTLIPSGSVTITVNGVFQLAAIDPITGNFTSSFATGALAIAGSPYPISFNYAGDTNFASATGASNLIVTPAPTTATVIGHTPSPSIFNQSVTFTATVTSAQGAPTGTVTLNEGATLLGTGTLNAGTVTFNLSSFSVGTHTITAIYQASGNYAASTSPSVAHVVNLAPTTATITGHTPSPSVFNQMVTFTATVTSTQGSPTGNVTLNDGATSVATGVLNSGVVTFTISTLAVGSHTVTAAYQTDASFANSTSPSITHLVNQASTTTTLTRSSPTTVFGQNLTFTVTVHSTQGTPTGTVTFYDGVTSLGTGSLDGSGIAALTTSTLTVTGSPHTITARYDGDTNFSTSTSVGIPQTVNKASTTAALNASSTNPTYGQSVYLTATLSITAPGAGTPTGTITFYDGATPLYTGTLSSNVVTFVTNTLIVNGGVAHNLTAKYNGDLNFNASPSSPAVNVTVNRATLNVSADNKMKVYGAPLPTLTVTYSGFGLGQDATVLTGSPTLTTVPATSPVGSYPITVTVGSLTAANYVFNLVNGTLTISAAQLTVSANNQSKLYGALNPTLTYSITGFVNSDTQSTALTGAPGLSTSATASSIVGTYPISVTQGTLRNTNLSALNYAFTLVNGTLTVNKDNTSARLTGAAPNPSTYGQAVAFTATVTSTQGIMVSGSVTFKDGATTLGSGILNASGVVTFTTSALTASGSPHSVTATFAGSSNFNASAASSAVKQTVNKATTATTLYAPTPNPSVAGQAITVSFSVAVNPPGAGTPTGTVTVTDGTASCTAPAGSTSCRITFNTAGTKTLTATYGGDVNFASSASSAIAHTVTLPTCSVPAVSNRTPFNLQNPAYRTFLPLILGNAVHAPDLIVQSILPVTTTLQVVLLNQGNEPVKDDFWVDLYINPNPIPTQVNQTWPFLATQGAVWGVVASSAAVPAGGTLKLNVGGPYYWSQLSTMPASLPAGSCVYVQVDSANASTNYGAVLEDHEMQNGTYNNITGIRLDSPITISAPRSVLSPRVTGTPLPSRPTQ